MRLARPETGLSLPVKYFIDRSQGRCRVFESGPVEESIEYRRHERGKSMRGGLSPLVRGVWGASPEIFFLNFERFYVRFNGIFFMHLIHKKIHKRNTAMELPWRYFFCGFFFCLVFAMPLCASVYMCFVVTCRERADLLALVCGVQL